MHNLVKKNKKTTRNIVSWSSKEDDILREQIRILGTDNWAMIASKFTDKTTRQCRRRWFTYLSSDLKKGGWSAEEDNLLCQAQKIFGNRWTEIAKVVPGRTDNAVKNRFSTLCKRRAKALAKENATPYVNLNNKRVVSQIDANATELSETRVPLKKIRRDISDMIERPQKEFRETNEQLTPTLAVIGQKVDILRNLETQASTDMIQGIYLEDSQEIIALIQQADQSDPQPNKLEQSNVNGDVEKHAVSCATTNHSEGNLSSDIMPPCDDLTADYGIVYDCSSNEFDFPLQVTPFFRSLALGDPSPQFTESEREFLLKTLGAEAASPIPSTTASRPPPCKSVLLQSL